MEKSWVMSHVTTMPHNDEPQAAESEGDQGKTSQTSNGSKAAPAPKTRRPATAPPWVADPKALALVQKAAAAIGLGVEALGNLIVDSGITALPPSDGITARYTLKDLGTRLWGTMQEYPTHLRAKWFHALTKTQRTAVIVTLRDKGFTTQVIALEFKIAQMQVVKTWNEHADNLGAQVVGLRLNTIAGNLQLVAERAQQGSMEKNDWATFWRIQKELTRAFADLGIVERSIHKVEVTHKFDEQKQSELDALLELERKKERRQEEIKLIPAIEVDEVPNLEDYDG